MKKICTIKYVTNAINERMQWDINGVCACACVHVCVYVYLCAVR